MFKRVVRAVRKKPKAVKDRYAFWSAAVLTGIVATVWMTSLTSGIQPVVEVETESAQLPNESTSLGDMVGELREEVANLSDSVRTAVATSSATSSVEIPSATTATATEITPEVSQGTEVRIATFTASTTDQ